MLAVVRRKGIRFLPIGILALLLFPANSSWGADRDGSKIEYNREIRPILSTHCFACHGPDEEHRARDLRLDRRDEATAAGPHGFAAIVPGDPDDSELLIRVTEEVDEFRMPPPKAGDRLSDDEIDLLRRWIEQGAEYEEHWAFVPPRDRPLPEVNDSSWLRNGIDHWILQRLEQEELAPAEEADLHALLRRVSLDLRGLPLSKEELEEFAENPEPDAYEQFVDRCLDDPAFGERWARVWLDLARYADSAGYGSDPLRPDIWRYRDWVIEAFNRNLPFDQFTIEQLAGDLLPEPTLDQRIATAFHRNTMTNTEGGTDDEEFRVAAVKDRANTTGQVWLGLTFGCAECHTHKFDPISHDEYYQFFGIFNQTADSDKPDESPTIPAPTPEQRERLEAIDTQIAALRTTLDTPTPELASAQAAWEESLQAPGAWSVLESTEVAAESGAEFVPLEDGSLLVEGTRSKQDVYTFIAETNSSRLTGLRLEALPDPSNPQGGSGRAEDGNFVLSRIAVEVEPLEPASSPTAKFVRVELPGENKILSLAEVQVFQGGVNVATSGTASQSSTAYEGAAARAIDGNTDGDYFEAQSTTHTRTEADPWWEVELAELTAIDHVTVWNRTDGNVGDRLEGAQVVLFDEDRNLIWNGPVPELPKPSVEFVPQGRQRLPLTQAFADHSQRRFPVANAIETKNLEQDGWAVAPHQGEPHAAVFAPKAPLGLQGPGRIMIRLEHQFSQPHYTLGRFRLAITDDEAMLRRAEVPPAILALIDTPDNDRTNEQRKTLATHYRSIAPGLQSVRDEIAQLEQSKPDVPKLPVMVELTSADRRSTHVLLKGNFLDQGELVEPDVPEFLHPLSEGTLIDRLTLARWLMNPANPLTSRVTVNRFWARIFGMGLVETEEDFGTQGDMPNHPELLDWLAQTYVDSGWDTKALLRLIVTSSTYRQTSKITPEALERDPRNVLLSRAPRFRLEAEMVRDQALALSGLLSRSIGGPSVFPPQPEGLWQAAFNNQRTWTTSTGPDRYRRGLYVFWRRTIPYPSMAAFDAPSRELCTVRRDQTNNPLQAFVTLNDPVYVEAAQALARRIVAEGGHAVEDRLRFGLWLALGRPPEDRQIEVLTDLFEQELNHYLDHPDDAHALATEPLGPLPEGADAAELAAWTTIANILLNLDGVLTKG